MKRFGEWIGSVCEGDRELVKLDFEGNVVLEDKLEKSERRGSVGMVERKKKEEIMDA
jgi:hypothetical protein